MKKFENIDEYIDSFPGEIQVLLTKLREIVKKAAPDAEEVISYNMPAMKYYGTLLYYAAHTNHIGFYPGNASTIEIFKDELEKFHTSKGTIQFPFDKTLPAKLITKIVKYRIAQNKMKAEAKKKKK